VSDLKKQDKGDTDLYKLNRRIKREFRRLSDVYSKIEVEKKRTVEGLIEQAAYMRITLQDLIEDLKENGFTEPFKQGKDQEPYDRKRPNADLFNTLNANYQKIIKQLTDLLPKTAVPSNLIDDGFEGFLYDREDV
jgi:hypothetical protein